MSITATRSNKRRKVLTLVAIALAAVATIALADVIYVYTGTINAMPYTTTPLVFSTGPNAGPSDTAAEPFINFTGTNTGTGFTATIALTNSSAAYFYQAGTLTVNTAGGIYVNSVITSGSSMINTMTIYIMSSSGSTVCTIPVLSNGNPATTPSSSCSLSTGTYYINIYVVPNTPIHSTYSETVTVNFGYNVVGSQSGYTSIPVP
ncbi:hypothetical protein [Vulcanisaeta sp. JCM 16159]|uniref:hypothetical protein n=1 Tax=Vulcanisaeta sp. JCM 16159 TaxID=1295371 RepID=UPI0006D26E8C|nr:hypothetical protein [Vulcanisaeta sp. JCM 16159]